MAFTKLSTGSVGVGVAPAPKRETETDIWAIFRALRDARSVFGLRPGHLQSLQAMISFLKPGHGDTVFASNASICERIGGIDERTLRRHINRFVELGFITRHDSSNRKRYRVRATNGDSISFGLSLSPLLARAKELFALAQEIENSRRDRVFLRKKILTKMAHLDEQDPQNTFTQDARKTLRRKLSIAEYRALLSHVNRLCHQLPKSECGPETVSLPANDGQTVRHHSKSKEELKDKERDVDQKFPDVKTLAAVCDQATSFSATPLTSWSDVESHARTLAPMMGIDPLRFENAKNSVGLKKASCAIFIILQLGSRVRDFAAYFNSLTTGQHRNQFDPCTQLRRLSGHSFNV